MLEFLFQEFLVKCQNGEHAFPEHIKPGENQVFETNPWPSRRVAKSCEEAWKMVIEKGYNESNQNFIKKCIWHAACGEIVFNYLKYRDLFTYVYFFKWAYSLLRDVLIVATCKKENEREGLIILYSTVQKAKAQKARSKIDG